LLSHPADNTETFFFFDYHEELDELCKQCLSFTLDDDDDDFFSFDPPSTLSTPTVDSTTDKSVDEDLVPSSLLIAKSVQDLPFAKPLKVLFDTGSDICPMQVVTS